MLENLINSLSEKFHTITKRSLPLILGSTLMTSSLSSHSSQAPEVDWYKYISFSRHNIVIPTLIKQLNDSEYLTIGVYDRYRDEDCLPYFSSLISQNNIPSIDETFGGCLSESSNLLRIDNDSFLIGVNEYASRRKISTELYLFQDSNIVSTYPFPLDIFSDRFILFYLNDDIYALGQSYGIKGLNIVRFEEDFSITNGYPVGILTDTYYTPQTLNTFDSKIQIIAQRSDPEVSTVYSAPTFIQLNNDFVVEDLVDYKFIAVVRGKIEKSDENFIFVSDVNRAFLGYNIAVNKTNDKGDLLEGYPKEFNFGTSYLINSSKNFEDNFSVLLSYRTSSTSVTPQVFSFDSDGNPLWDRVYNEYGNAGVFNWELTLDGGYALTGRQYDTGAFVLKLLPETPILRSFHTNGVQTNPFQVDVDGYNFSSRELTEEEKKNQYLEFLRDVLENINPSKKQLKTPSSDIQVEEFYPLIVPYISNNPHKNTFGLSLSASNFFSDPLYFLDNGVGIQMPTYQRNEDDDVVKKRIKQEQQKFSLSVMARNLNIVNDSNPKQKLIDLLSNNRTAIINFYDEGDEITSVLAYKLELDGPLSNVFFYDPSYPGEEKSASINNLTNRIEYNNYNHSFIEDPNYFSAGGIVLELLEKSKKRYLEEILRSGLDIVTIFPHLLSKQNNQSEFLFMDSYGNKYGYENGIFYEEIPIRQTSLDGIISFSIPSDINYTLYLSNSSNQNLSIINSDRNTQTTLAYSNISSNNLTFNSSTNSLYDENILVNPNYSQEDISFYDLNNDNKINYLDFFSISNTWKKTSGPSTYDDNFLLRMIELE